MLALCIISLFTISSGCAMRKNPVFHDTQLNMMLDTDSNSSFHYKTMKDVDVYNKLTNGTNISYEKFIPFLLNKSMQLLENAQNNIVKNYDLSAEDIKDIEVAFASNKYQYEIVLNNNLKSMMNSIKYNSAEIFLLDFTDFSNYLLEKIIQNSLSNVKGKLLVPSKWNKHLFKYTIIRQQTKIIMNIMEVEICYKFSLCVPKSVYSEYVVEWLRHLLNMDSIKLKEFINLIPQMLHKHMHTIKTNEKFRQKSKYVSEADLGYQRNLIDFIDEVITEQDFMKVVPHNLRKYVIFLKDLFLLIDANYDLNVENEKKMDHLNKKFWLWAVGDSIQIIKVLEEILENMSLNVLIWSNEAQTKLGNIWMKIVVL